jgi:hypothetical protein
LVIPRSLWAVTNTLVLFLQPLRHLSSITPANWGFPLSHHPEFSFVLGWRPAWSYPGGKQYSEEKVTILNKISHFFLVVENKAVLYY